MSSGLGIAIGSTNSTAAVCPVEQRNDRDAGLPVTSYPTLLRLSADAAPILGARRVRSATATTGGSVVIDGFAARVGDPVGILAEDGATYAGEDLVATAVGCLVHEAAVEMKVDGAVMVAYPSHWNTYTTNTLREALSRAGLADATPVSDSAAVVRWLKAREGTVSGGPVLIYDLGGSSLDISVVDPSDARLLAEPVHTEEISGSAFDHVVLQQVLANSASTGLDPFDPATELVLAEIRTRCTAAKEALSAEIETTLPIDIGNTRREVRLVRDEFEDLIRPLVIESVDMARGLASRAGVGTLGHLVLVGGGASIPLVAELLSAEFGIAVTVSPQPQFTATLGAAMLAADAMVAATRIVAPMPVAVPAAAAATRLAPVRTPKPIKPAAAAVGRGARRLGVIIGAAAAVTALAAGGLAVGTGVAPLPEQVREIIGANPTTPTPHSTTKSSQNLVGDAETTQKSNSTGGAAPASAKAAANVATTTPAAAAAKPPATTKAPAPPPPPPPTVAPPPSEAPPYVPTLPPAPTVQLPSNPIQVPVIGLPLVPAG
ncbi:MAG: Hsp70 family protein [Nocardiaceae bacterium]|nr:Hsp70 family protein [Nocardiaceae bacterium]